MTDDVTHCFSIVFRILSFIKEYTLVTKKKL